MSNPTEGWYPDPDGKPSERYWDGSNWTEQTRPIADKPSNAAAFGGCLIVTVVLAVIVLVTFSCVKGDDAGGAASAPSEQFNPTFEMDYQRLSDWVKTNNASTYFVELGELGYDVVAAARDLKINRMADLIDEMALIGYQMKILEPSPDTKFNEYWTSIYTDLIEMGTYTPAIRKRDTEALKAVTVITERMTATSTELNEYTKKIFLK